MMKKTPDGSLIIPAAFLEKYPQVSVAMYSLYIFDCFQSIPDAAKTSLAKEMGAIIFEMFMADSELSKTISHLFSVLCEKAMAESASRA